jgi:hypothetical protein
MTKSCAQIAEDINELKRNIQQSKMINKFATDLIKENKNCSSKNANIMCENCICWKIVREYCS